jgi:class 3 adenylate cyclase/tetratricopeptide (TPR) repeat protein
VNCADCGALLPPAARFCPQCARAVGAAALREAPPEAYTPPHLAAKIRGAREAIEGERKRITVLFADLHGSMELVADRDPEEARTLFDGVLEWMMEAVHRYEGTVNQILGDGIMALFGAPVAHEDHAVRACYAALRMQDSISRFAARLAPGTGELVRIRVGLNSGEVLVRAIAGDLHMDYTAVGQTTHLAARMEQMAEPGTILATAEVARLVEGYVQARRQGERSIRGLAQPVEVFEVLGTVPLRTRVQVAERRGLSRFVGREAELTQLGRALALAEQGRGQVVALVGEPGVGKSRLVLEFVRAESGRGFGVFESTTLSHGEATPYFPIATLLRRLLEIDAAASPREVRSRIVRRLTALDVPPVPHFAALAALYGANTGDRQWEALDPPQRHRSTLEAVKALLLAQARVQPLVLVVEDLHWIDAESQDVLDHLVRALSGSRMLLVVEYRPEYSNEWTGMSAFTALRVAPLSQERAADLLKSLLGEDPGLAPLARRLLARTEGNPLFLEESVRALAESKALEGAPGAYRLARPLDTIRIPAMVQDVLASRLDLLPAREKALVQVAAAIGKDVSAAVLKQVAGLPEAELAAALARLQASEFLVESALFPDLQYAFKHAFTHEVVYSSLPHQRRRRLHTAIVEAMEEVYAGRTAERIEILAHHAMHGELWEPAVGYLRQAAARAYERSAYRSAVAYLDQAIRALSRLPATRATAELAIDLRFEQRNPLLALGALDRMLASVRESEALAEDLGDAKRRARVAAQLTGYLWLTAQYPAAAEVGERALALAGRDDTAVTVPTRFYLGAARHSMGDYRRTVELLQANVAALGEELAAKRFGMAGLPSVFSRAWLAWAHAEMGEFAPAEAAAADAGRIATASGHPFSVLTARFAAAMTRLLRGEPGEATRIFEPGLAMARGERLPLWIPPFATQLGVALARTARCADAVALLERVLQAPSDAIAFTPFAAAALAEAYLLSGRIEDAAPQVERALQRARYKRERGYEAWALKLSGDVSAARDPAAGGAAEHYRAAIALARELGMRPLMAQAWLALGDLHAQAGRMAEAGAAFEQALKLLEAMDVAEPLEKARAAAAAALKKAGLSAAR